MDDAKILVGNSFKIRPCYYLLKVIYVFGYKKNFVLSGNIFMYV